jgi:hypothetical protein
MRTTIKLNAPLVTAGVVLSTSYLLSAAAINVDIQGANAGGPGFNLHVGTYTGQAVPVTGTTWNGIAYQGVVSTTLVDDQNVTTDVNFWSQTNLGEWSYDAGGGGVNLAAEALMADYAFTNGSNNRFTLFSNVADGGSGLQLTAGSTWDVYVYLQGDSAGQGATLTLNYADGNSSSASTTGDGPWNGTFVEGGNYVKFSGVTPRAYTVDGTNNGYEFDFVWGLNGGSAAGINGIQLVQVPEPSTIALLGGVGILSLFRRRR